MTLKERTELAGKTVIYFALAGERTEKASAQWVQDYFDTWTGEVSAQTGLHPDDDREELWERFVGEHTK